MDLGSVTLAGHTLGVTKLGELTPGEEGAFMVHPAEASVSALASLNVFLWVEDEAGTKLCAAAKGSREGDALHFHVTPRKGLGEPHRVVVRVRVGDEDESAGLPLDGHGHEHVATPHHGILAKFASADGAQSGHLELKLHDDKGDIELWLARDKAMKQPFDVPLDAAVRVKFIDVDGKQVSLRVRNVDANEDEDGQPNVRDGLTNYFIYPSKPEQDSSWLRGEDFQSIVELSWTAGGKSYRSEEFVLSPHTH